MAVRNEADLYTRTLAEVRESLLERAGEARNPMDNVPFEVAKRVLDRLDALDRDRWAQAFCAEAEPHFAVGLEAETAGNAELAHREFLAAFGLFRVARYPAPNSPAKREAYRRSQEAFFKAAAYQEPRVERVEMPYVGDLAPGATIVGLLYRPRRDGRFPVVVQWGGIDAFKEDRRPEPYLGAGLAVLAVDMPGVADAPIPGSERGEELWNGIFDWIAAEPGLDEQRIGLVGGSTGGYWAAKLAHTHRDRIAAAVDHGGPTHYAFQPDWIARSSRGEYPFELVETLASAHGRATAAEWLDFAPRMSLLEQGWLDEPCAPLLCVNGVLDSIFPIEDMYLLLRHGSPKTARFFASGHMGHDPELYPTIVRWIARELTRA